jgi:hypothetical protein
MPAQRPRFISRIDHIPNELLARAEEMQTLALRTSFTAHQNFVRTVSYALEPGRLFVTFMQLQAHEKLCLQTYAKCSRRVTR